MRNKRTISQHNFVRFIFLPIVKLVANNRTAKIFERIGLHVTRVGFYSPVPDVFSLANRPWDTPHPFDQLAIDETKAIEFYSHNVDKYRDEITEIHFGGNGFYVPDNGAFEGLDAELLYMMIRSMKPRRIIEIGSGFSTCCMLDAIEANRQENPDYNVDYKVYDPYPLDDLSTLRSDVVSIHRTPAQELSPEVVANFEPGDVFFIDSSHVLAIGSDVSHLFLNILPVLPCGVLIHVHDIFLPSDYPRRWIRDARLFWNEQYLLYALLLNDPRLEVIWPGHRMHLAAAAKLREISPTYDPDRSVPGSFWFSRRETT